MRITKKQWKHAVSWWGDISNGSSCNGTRHLSFGRLANACSEI